MSSLVFRANHTSVSYTHLLICAALLKPGSSIQIEKVSLNPGRVGFIRTLERMGASIEVRYLTAEGKEPIGLSLIHI